MTFAWVRLVDGQPVDPVYSGTTVTLVGPPAPYPDGLSLVYRLTVSDGHLTGPPDAQLPDVEGDLVDGSVTPSCTPPSGSLFRFGAKVVTCSATDAHGNTGSASFKVSVNPFTFLGFFQLENVTALGAARTNTVKGGATVPVTWRLQGKGGTEFTDVAAVTRIQALEVACEEAGAETAIDTAMAGGTVLRYDFAAMQFIFNWKTPKSPGRCLRLDVRFTDETTHSARFSLK